MDDGETFFRPGTGRLSSCVSKGNFKSDVDKFTT